MQTNNVLVTDQAQSLYQIKRQRNETKTSLDPKKRSRFIEPDSTSQTIYNLATSTIASNQPLFLENNEVNEIFRPSRSSMERPIQESHTSAGYLSQGAQNHAYGVTSQVHSLQTMQASTSTNVLLQPAGNSQPTSDGKLAPFQPLSDNITAMGHFLSSLQQASNPAPPNNTVSDYMPRTQPREQTTASSTQSYSPWLPSAISKMNIPDYNAIGQQTIKNFIPNNYNYSSFQPVILSRPSTQMQSPVPSLTTVPSMPLNNYIYSLHSPANPARNADSKMFRQEPMTPVAKQGSYGFYDNSPGTDYRFSESLSNLLGSPPSDSPLSKNPFFGDLQSLLNNECKKEIVPQTLFAINPKKETEEKRENVFTRERNLQERFSNLQSSHPEEIRQLSSVFRYQSALIETERFRTLHESQYPGSYKDSVNKHYDEKLHEVMDRVEKSVRLLEDADKENKSKTKAAAKTRPHLNKEAIQLMEGWYSQNQDHPYPTSTTIELLAHSGNIGIEQVKKWFANKRNRNQNTRSLTEIAIQKRKLGQLSNRC
ncbi:hypothetical protein DPMN_143379 [Dreissena polymorpha]|uniref:Homeobox domain-containing protein n=2 Tax=Dreissena polymorpha TaxID=45954 RepID=A0A9D4JK04_DREPO|nr:hypothetical protein DPMN_143379 [Dreissena polymorpha]